jgi:hypothetical protein
MEASPKPIKKTNFCRIWANFCRPLADESFRVSCSVSSSTIHGELPCITIVVRSNFSEFLPSQVHHELNDSHSLQSLYYDVPPLSKDDQS